MEAAAAIAEMKAKRHFPAQHLTKLAESKILRIRAGSGDHRFIGIWVVVVNSRVFVRSWSVTPKGWYKSFLKDRTGAVQLAGKEITIRTVPIKNKRLRDAIDQAYLDKYNTTGSLKYAQDLGSRKSRATTIELVPSSSKSASVSKP